MYVTTVQLNLLIILQKLLYRDLHCCKKLYISPYVKNKNSNNFSIVFIRLPITAADMSLTLFSTTNECRQEFNE